MGTPDPAPVDGGLFDECQTRARAEFALALAVTDTSDLSQREVELVEVAIAAGVVGTLAVLHNDDGDSDLDPDRR